MKALLPEGQAVDLAPHTGPLWSLIEVTRTAVPAPSGSLGNESGSSLRPGGRRQSHWGLGPGVLTRAGCPALPRVCSLCNGSVSPAGGAGSRRPHSQLVSVHPSLAPTADPRERTPRRGSQHGCSHEGAGPLGWEHCSTYLGSPALSKLRKEQGPHSPPRHSQSPHPGASLFKALGFGDMKGQ